MESNKKEEELISMCRRVLACDSRALGQMAVCKTFAREVLETLLRSQESRCNGSEFASYRYDADAAREAWERN